MDNTTELLEMIAAKLGTTTEYLWSVLIKQAQVDSIINLLLIVAIFVSGIFIYKIHVRLSKKDDEGSCIYDEEGEYLSVVMVIFSIVWVIFFIISVISIGNIITGLLHPEYWALDRILKLI